MPKGLIIALGVFGALILASGGVYFARIASIPNHGLEMLIELPQPQAGEAGWTPARVSQVAERLQRRGVACGARGTKATAAGVDRVLVRYPGATDAKMPCFLKTGDLGFYLLDEHYDGVDIHGYVPYGRLRPPSDDRYTPHPVLMPRRLLSGEDIASASAAFDAQTSAPVVSFRLNKDGAARFYNLTQHNIGKRFAIVLDGRVITAPNILGPIPGGSGQITGNFTREGAEALAAVLTSGALPTGMRPLTVNHYGPKDR